MSAFIVNSQTMSVVGYVQNIEGVEIKEGQLLLQKPDDLITMTNQQLTDLFNSLTKLDKGDDAPVVGTFKTSKLQSATKVFNALEAIDVSKLMQLDKVEEKVVEEQAKIVAQEEVAAAAAAPNSNDKKVRKVRDSKLQRMKAAFLVKEESGEFKQWTVKELMERCGTSERITHVYISILRSPSDRFVMNIEKMPVTEGAAPAFMYKPKEDRKSQSVQSEQPAAE